MSHTNSKRIATGAAAFATLLCLRVMLGQSTPEPSAPPNNAPAQTLSPQQLDNLVAPIVLYPDPILGEILAATTHPFEIAEAQANGKLQSTPQETVTTQNQGGQTAINIEPANPDFW